MKRNILIFFLLLLSSIQLFAVEDTGLFFKSYSVPSTERTLLTLNNNEPFHFKNDFMISFQMRLHNGPEYGAILNLSSDSDNILLAFSTNSEDKNIPAIMYKQRFYPLNTFTDKRDWTKISMSINTNNNLLVIKYGERTTKINISGENFKNVMPIFGKTHNSDIAPIIIKDIKIFSDNKYIRHWELGKHNEDICFDEITHSPAIAKNPKWLIDSHIKWENILSTTFDKNVDVTFDSNNGIVYMIGKDKIMSYNCSTTETKEISIIDGFPAMEYPEHVVYDTINNRIISYSLSNHQSSFLDLNKKRWTLTERHKEKGLYYNHTKCFNSEDSCFYFFGGYGYYQYRNKLFKMNVNSGTISEIDYSPKISPRYSAASAIVGNNLYIFGGKGNEKGRQEFSQETYCELQCINLKTRESKLVWKKNKANFDCLLASTMCFEPADSTFHIASLDHGGTLFKISMKDSIVERISRPIGNGISFQDIDFCLFSSDKLQKYFLIINRILNNGTYNLNIYSINQPFYKESDIIQDKEKSKNHGIVFIGSTMLIVFMIIGIMIYVVYKKKHNQQQNKKGLSEEKGDNTEQIEIETEEPQELFFNRSSSAISLLGTFNVKDKEGNDITSLFTPRLKNLLILIILFSEKDEKGILTKKAINTLWPEKEEDAARNNLNVTLRKLRIQLEQVGDIEITSDNGFLRIAYGEEVFCDYHQALFYLNQFKENKNESNDSFINKLLELLLYGPLLSNTIIDWLDEFKDAYSSLSIDSLIELLQIKQDYTDIQLRIANIIFLHDPLNEEALSAKCSVLFRQSKKGIAMNVYNRFCKEYRESLGEDYKKSFGDIYR